jgi:hypothetical protein
VPPGQVRIEVEAELGQLHADLAVDAALVNALQRIEVVRGDRIGFGGVGQVLAEVGEDGADAVGGQPLRRFQRIGELLAGHESSNGASSEPQPRHDAAQPRIPGRPQQHCPHRRIVAKRGVHA